MKLLRTYLLLGLAFTFLFVACKDTTTNLTDPVPSNLTGTVLTSDSKEGISETLLVLTGNSSNAETLSDENGRFEFRSIEPGEYNISMRLPSGYRAVGESERNIYVDENKQILFEGEPIRQITTTIPRGERDTLSTISGANVEIDLSDCQGS